MQGVDRDTIFAVASGIGRAAIAVLRLSGPDSGKLVDALAGARPDPRRASQRRLRDSTGDVLDRAVVLWIPGPASYTGEDSAELHLHGGAAVVAGVADALTALGARPAEPGEFTRRAFHNGRMDLVEAEAVADLVDAETSAQRRQALRQLEGELGRIYRDWTDRLIGLLARQEALIDFPDEDIPPDVAARMDSEIQGLHTEIAAYIDDDRRGERLRDGLVFAIVGAPNVGKSTLINALAERDVAIVSPVAGTTRDVLEARVVFGGVPVTLLDTAGLRDSADAIEAEGVKRALSRAASADLVLAVAAADDPDWTMAGDNLIRIVNKIDLASSPVGYALPVSARTGAGMAALRTRLDVEALRLTQRDGPPPLTRARHRTALMEAAAHLGAAANADLPELRGEDLRMALRGIGRVTGTVGVEDILDSVFRQFCIGK